MDDAPTLSQFALHAYDKLRYADTDRQGHVNNSVFSTALETGRVELLTLPTRPSLNSPNPSSSPVSSSTSAVS